MWVAYPRHVGRTRYVLRLHPLLTVQVVAESETEQQVLLKNNLLHSVPHASVGKNKGWRPMESPPLRLNAVDALRYRTLSPSATIFGVMKTSNSVLSSIHSRFLNNQPIYGRSPKNGILWVLSRIVWV